MKERYMVLKLTDVNDTASFNKIVEYRKNVKSIRVDVEKKRVSLKADSLEYGRRVDSEANRITQLLLPIEKHLLEQEDFRKKEKERIKAEKQAEIKEKHRKRILLIVESGATFNGSDYVYGENTISNIELWNYSDEQLSLQVDAIKLWKEKENIKEEAETKKRLEEEKRQSEIAEQQRQERAALDKIAEEQAVEAEKIKTERQNIQREKEKILDRKIASRKDSICSIGFKWNGDEYEYEELEVCKNQIEDLSDEEFEDLILGLKSKVKNINDIKESNRKNQIEEASKKVVKDKIAADKQAEIEAERKAKLLPEKEKLLSLAEKFMNPNLPILESNQGKAIIENVKNELVELALIVKASANNI